MDLSALKAALTVREAAAQMGLSDGTARRLFLREPGVLQLPQDRGGKRRYRSIRIPRAVFERVYQRLTK